jgi:hypothetical protein
MAISSATTRKAGWFLIVSPLVFDLNAILAETSRTVVNLSGGDLRKELYIWLFFFADYAESVLPARSLYAMLNSRPHTNPMDGGVHPPKACASRCRVDLPA